jgi:hypothetical protein
VPPKEPLRAAHHSPHPQHPRDLTKVLLELREPECTGVCCGFLSVVVRRIGGIVQWSVWPVPEGQAPPPEFDFDARQYDAELARVLADQGQRGRTVPCHCQ